MAQADISMNATEIEAFLARCPQMVVGALDADGWPTGTLAASSHAEGVLRLQLAVGDAVIDEIAGDPTICCVADEHATYYEIRGVIIHGRAEPDDDRPGAFQVSIAKTISFDFGRLRAG
jgi:nitroimidazol reductase NimA-like FMN-containing flavoprotein (pyridoxamine 5'-phosphate oxidase superfamily)